MVLRFVWFVRNVTFILCISNRNTEPRPIESNLFCFICFQRAAPPEGLSIENVRQHIVRLEKNSFFSAPCATRRLLDAKPHGNTLRRCIWISGITIVRFEEQHLAKRGTERDMKRYARPIRNTYMYCRKEKKHKDVTRLPWNYHVLI